MKDIKEENKAAEVIVKGAGYVFVGMIVSKLLTYIYRIIIARIGTEEYGILSLGLAILGIISIFPIFGLDSGVLRFVSDCVTKDNKNKAKQIIINCLAIIIPISLLISIFLFLFSENISYFFNEPRLINVIKLLAICLPFIGIGNIFLSTISSFKNTKHFVLIKNILENIIKILVTAFLVFLGLNYIGATIGYVISIVSTGIIAFLFVNKNMLRFTFSNIKVHLIDKAILVYSVPLMFNMLISQVIGWTDVIMIGFFRTGSEVGIYNAALPTSTLIYIIPSGLIALFIPVMSSLFLNKNFEQFRSTSKDITKWIFYINLPVTLLIIVFSKHILKFLFGTDYVVGYSSLIILVVGFFIYHLFLTSSRTLNIIKKSEIIMSNMMIAAILNIIINFILIPKIGILGGAIATALSMIVHGLLNGIYSFYYTKIIPFSLSYFKAFFAAIISLFIMVFIIKIFYIESIYFLLVLALLFLVVYTILIIIFKCLNDRDYHLINLMRLKAFNNVSKYFRK